MIKEYSINKILILRTERIGDFCLTLPALKMLRENFPKSEIDIIVNPLSKKLAEATPYIDRTFTFKNPLLETTTKLDVLTKYALNYINLKRFWKKYSEEKYDLVINFSNRKIGELLFRGVEGRKKISAFRYSKKDISEQRRMVEFLEEEGLKYFSEKAKISIPKKTKNKVKKLIEKNKNIVIHPFTYLEFKNWDKEKWIELIKKTLQENKKTHVHLIGGDGDHKRCQEITDKINSSRVKNLCGEFNLVETVAFINENDLYIGVDSGPMHLAELTSTPIIALFGPTNENIWGPHRKKDKIIKENSMEEISVKNVLEKIN